jgi:hypothetical protein
MNSDHNDDNNIIDFKKQKQVLRRKAKEAARKEGGASGPGWLKYIQFLVFLLLIFYLLQQC